MTRQSVIEKVLLKDVLIFFNEYQYCASVEAGRPVDSYCESSKKIRENWQKYPLSAYRITVADVATRVVHMRQADREAFLHKFREAFGRDFFQIATDPKKIADKVVARGRIATDSQFYAVKDYVLSLDDSEEPLKATLFALLEAYENRPRRKAAPSP